MKFDRENKSGLYERGLYKKGLYERGLYKRGLYERGLYKRGLYSVQKGNGVGNGVVPLLLHSEFDLFQFYQLPCLSWLPTLPEFTVFPPIFPQDWRAYNWNILDFRDYVKGCFIARVFMIKQWYSNCSIPSYGPERKDKYQNVLWLFESEPAKN